MCVLHENRVSTRQLWDAAYDACPVRCHTEFQELNTVVVRMSIWSIRPHMACTADRLATNLEEHMKIGVEEQTPRSVSKCCTSSKIANGIDKLTSVAVDYGMICLMRECQLW